LASTPNSEATHSELESGWLKSFYLIFFSLINKKFSNFLFLLLSVSLGGVIIACF